MAPLSVPSAEDPPLHCCVPHLPSAFRPVCPSPICRPRPPGAPERAFFRFGLLGWSVSAGRGAGGATMPGMMVDTLFPSKPKSGDELRCVALMVLRSGEAAAASLQRATDFLSINEYK